MDITITVDITLGKRLQYVRERTFWIGWIARLIGLGLLALGIFVLNFDGFFLVLGVVYFFGPELLAVIGHFATRRFGKTYTYTLTESGIEATTAVSTTHLAWAAFKSIRQSHNSWRFGVSGISAIVLPKSDFTPEQAAEWQTFVTTAGLIKA
ncbi:YcxB family protein [Streptomyces sp. SID13031]|uniref:YcxB family protein n=1 Tax=Streptomyces sp. SID13031 TaxID=2706046 RepID=UPI0013CD696E|nr:YcxB family protein [Streptomyces sp. SID13031]NEA31272.1 YcxB family protein [Streptomyces sp. SID13031]